jgi:hypothetical protein
VITKSLLVFNTSIILIILVSLPKGMQAGTLYECKDQIGTIVISDIPLGKGYNCKPLEFFREITNEERRPRETERDKGWKAKQEKKESVKHDTVKRVQTERHLIDLKNIAFKIPSAGWGKIKRNHDPARPIASEEKTARDTPVKQVETKRQLVGVNNIAFKIAGDGKELLFIEFDRFYMPTISGVEGNEPKIILEIKNASSLREDWAAINTGGNFIQQIHGSMESQTGSALIVLDMVPDKDYFISQAFYEIENVYALEISDEKKIRLP